MRSPVCDTPTGTQSTRSWRGLINSHDMPVQNGQRQIRRGLPMQQIADWLEKLGLGQYAQRFAENDIDFEILTALTDQDLEKIGFTSLGHRRKLLRAIANLKGVEKITPAVTVAVAPPASPREIGRAHVRQVTVMFSDLVGSTELFARMDPEDLRGLI